jgi:hypothetical protein
MLTIAKSKLSRLSYSEVVNLPLESIFNRTEASSFYEISGGLIPCDRHLHILSDAVKRFKPRHPTVYLGGNDLDGKCIIAEQVSFLTQLKNKFSLQTVMALCY